MGFLVSNSNTKITEVKNLEIFEDGDQEEFNKL